MVHNCFHISFLSSFFFFLIKPSGYFYYSGIYCVTNAEVPKSSHSSCDEGETAEGEAAAHINCLQSLYF